MKKIFKVRIAPGAYAATILLVRIVAGLAFMFHGWKKINNPFGWMGDDSVIPGVFQSLAAVSEFMGGLCLIVGLLTPLVSLGIFFTMAGAVYKHAVVDGGAFVGGKGAYELALLYAVIMLLFIAAGPGKYSADRYIFGEKV